MAATGLLAGKISVITGASSGLGRATALAFVKHGATVVCADLEASVRASSGGISQRPTHEAILESGGKSAFVATDVGDVDSVENLVRETAKKFGRLDIMVNNAGIAPEASNPRPVFETPVDIFDSVSRVNVRGVFLGCKYAGAQMIKQPKIASYHSAGAIINLASVLGVVGLGGTPAYAASKGAVISMTRAMAMDFAPYDIHCNSILPGFTRTPMISSMTEDEEFNSRLSQCHPFQRIVEPEEIADAAVFLASQYAKGITAVNLSVDGGLHAQLRLK